MLGGVDEHWERSRRGWKKVGRAGGGHTPGASRASAEGLGRPADALADNLRAYRLLRHMTQDELASRMAHLGHGWGRSTVSAVEDESRNVTVDELFGLALSLGVTIGQLLDPRGPDRGPPLRLDVGLRSEENGQPQPIAARLAQLWVSSRAVLRLDYDDGAKVEVDLEPQMADEISF